MQNRVRAIASVITLGVFIYFALASFGSTNTSVVPEKCEAMPDFTGDLLIGIDYNNAGGALIPNVAGTLFLVHQRVQDTMTCQSLILSSQLIPFNTGSSGFFDYTTPVFTHSNSGDLWRIEVDIPPLPGTYIGGRKVSVAKYSTTFINLIFQDPAPL